MHNSTVGAVGIYNRKLHWFAVLTGIATLALIFVGALVTSTDSGLSVPDWPNTYGQFMFSFPLADMVGGILYEHGHRMLASIIGMLMIILTVWIWRTETRRWVRQLAFAALVAVVLQGVLGGITVLFFLPTPISVLHATIAQTFFLLVVTLAYVTSREGATPQSDKLIAGANYQRWAIIATVAIYLQLILGAIMRHTGSGLAFMDFPLSAGEIIPSFSQAVVNDVNFTRWELELPPVTVTQMVFHTIHRIGALIVAGTIIMSAYKALKVKGLPAGLRRMAIASLILLVIQVSLGIATILTLKQVLITTSHVMTGAALLGLNFFTTMRMYRLYGLVRTDQPITALDGELAVST